MDINTIINIAQIVVWVILGGLSLYFRTNSRLKEVAGDYISEAESVYKDTVKAGRIRCLMVPFPLVGKRSSLMEISHINRSPTQ